MAVVALQFMRGYKSALSWLPDTAEMKHILILPFLLAGHITPMLNLCCKLARITLLINQDAVETVVKIYEELVAGGDLSAEVAFTVESIPFSWPPIRRLGRDTAKLAEEVATRALESSSGPISFLLSDIGLGVPRVVLFITVFLEFGIILQMPRLISQKIYSPFTISRRSPVLLERAPAMHVASQGERAHPRQLVPRARRRGLRCGARNPQAPNPPLVALSPLQWQDSGATSECLEWLDRIKLPRSVLFASFGSLLQLPSSELEEILLVGGFFTHFGWNSALESISAGVLMIGKPIMGDQLGIRRFAVDRWKIALDIPEDKDKKLLREAVKVALRELFGNEELYANAARLSKSVKKAQESGGSYKCWDMARK
ncbi:DIMBOA UDP-glucosyltransferase BX8 [Selaginella moellendorffii]|uniref:DIMBOA UDP-glucosyltransferase BX8 n=1 Tax=Selaginella moellendorffii TaxID=88036 RepID=UPI000D1CE360|nr:DIMBOA UDP-glucosyltransferase BX8 [Selaginella moellendorffii]|eukprot:XP_024518959.1 DIMBOA UDP-glucosyltransferase BX8 [Selaginella moellendorffii]